MKSDACYDFLQIFSQSPSAIYKLNYLGRNEFFIYLVLPEVFDISCWETRSDLLKRG